MKYTQYFHLKKPDEEDSVKIGDLNDNMDIVEAEIRKRPEKAASLSVLGLYACLLYTYVGALVSAFLYLWDTSDEFRQFFIDMGDSIASAFEAVGDFFVSLFTEKIPDALQKMKDFFKKIWDRCV